MLTRNDGEVWQRSNQVPLMRAALAVAKIAGGSFHTVRHTYASLAIMAGTPLNVIAANLGHSDTRMIEKHYGHMSRNYVAESIRQHAPTYDLPEDSNLVPMRR